MVFIEPKHTLISNNKCYCNNKFSCFPLYNMSGCRLLISRQIYMKLHYMSTVYIYASVGIKKMDCYRMMTRKERSIKIEICTIWICQQDRQEFKYMSDYNTRFGCLLFGSFFFNRCVARSESEGLLLRQPRVAEACNHVGLGARVTWKGRLQIWGSDCPLSYYLLETLWLLWPVASLKSR